MRYQRFKSQFCPPHISNRIHGIFVPPGKLGIVDGVEWTVCKQPKDRGTHIARFMLKVVK